MADAGGAQYTQRLQELQGRRWKRLLRIQAPYRWAVRHLTVGRVLDVGCGIGRNLDHLDGRAVGVDTNAESVRIARGRGFEAYDADEFAERAPSMEPFDTLLASHVLEHVGTTRSPDVLRPYVDLLRPAARLVLITPQEVGFRTDPTHVELLGFDELSGIAAALGFTVTRRWSFPFPRPVGRVFAYNEFVVVADRAARPVDETVTRPAGR